MSLNRRGFLKAAGYGFTALCLPPWLAREARADTATNVLVVGFMQGGADGLSLAIPDGDAYYPQIRPNIGIDPASSHAISSVYAKAANRTLGMEDYFRLHPAWGALKSRFDAGELSVVHAVGRTGSYSHFTAVDGMEKADPVSATQPSGWLYRALHQLTVATPMSGVGLSGRVISSIAGPDQSRHIGVSSLSRFDLVEPATGDRRGVLSSMYDPARLIGWNATAQHGLDLLAESTAQLFPLLTTIDTLGLNQLGTDLTGTPYEGIGKQSWGRTLRDAAALIKADASGAGLGVRIIALDLSGWDHHYNLATSTGTRAQQFAEALDAFMIDLGGAADRTLLLTMTEFGRTAFENGSQGADHGFGTIMLALGGAGTPMLGGRVLARAADDGSDAVGWPGLGPGQLHHGQQPKYNAAIDPALISQYDPNERDLQVTIDFRDVFADVLQGHLGLTPGQIYGDTDKPLLNDPSYTPTPLPDGGLFATPEP